MKKLFILLIAAFLLPACAAQSGPAKAELPAGKAFAEGKDIFFVHTEASDTAIAEKLTTMMKSPVLYVPALAETPDSALANVYVFSNGLQGKGPLGFQSDVFDNPPGSAGYSPLRRLNVVAWVNESQASELRSAADVLAAEQSGRLSIEQPGVVINMPFVVWDGGKR
jgi:hypothetical protein